MNRDRPGFGEVGTGRNQRRSLPVDHEMRTLHTGAGAKAMEKDDAELMETGTVNVPWFVSAGSLRCMEAGGRPFADGGLFR